MYFFQVSWIRTRDIRVLAIGRVRYTQDTRFTPLHEEGNDVWALKIQETRMSDSGLYECQISYHDDVEKKLKKPVKLLVLGKTQFPCSKKSCINRTAFCAQYNDITMIFEP